MSPLLPFRLLLVAVRCYSRLPAGGSLAQRPTGDACWVAPTIRLFPLVGLIVATLTAIVYAIAGLLLPHGVALLAAITAGLMLTGALHERGLVRSCDAPGGERIGKPLANASHDAPIGTYGAAGLILILLGRYETLAAIDPSWIGVSLVTAAGLSRGCAVAVMLGLPRVRDDVPTTADSVNPELSMRDAAIAIAIALLPVALAALWTGALAVFGVAVAGAIAATAWLRRRLRARLGGYTSDSLDAVQQISEIAFLVGTLAMLALAAESGAAEPGPNAID